MIHQIITLPAPFYRLEVFSLVEPMRETEDEVFLQHRLYLKNVFAEGGKVLLRAMPEYSVSKRGKVK